MKSILVANRGEIARRVFATARRLGIGTVAVYSDADAQSPHVREADAAVRLPGSTPAETYLRGDLIIEATCKAGADAIHPGYGFLSENAGFARAVQAAGLTWIGPTPEAIDAMGSKIESKKMMAAAGVPVLEELDPATITAEQLPVLVKASAGGGGRGMRIVERLEDLAAAVEGAAAEAQSAFGDPTVFCERYLPTGHHVEVQVMADGRGTVWAVGERECSIQRRHQKVVEEAPSPLVERTPGMRDRLFDAARAAASSIGYLGAGTVEFLADDNGDFFFLEMNTRLQVEHPVTECTTGLDLVALQIEVASGSALEKNPPATQGHSIEVRLYAEDPAADWQPQSGPVHILDVPGVTATFEVGGRPAGIRLDSTVESGSTVGIHYDPMLAKVISWAPTRSQAARSLAATLERTTLHGLRTNRDLLVNVLRHKAFLDGATDTAFFDAHGLDTLAASPVTPVGLDVSARAAALWLDGEAKASATVLKHVPSGWRNVRSQPHTVDLLGPDGPMSVDITLIKRELLSPGQQQLRLDHDGVGRTFTVSRYADEVFVDSSLGNVRFEIPERFPDPADQIAAGSLVAPMPGAVVRLAVSVGDQVTAGQPVLWLEAMKMQHQINAPADGVVSELPVSAGQQVDVGTVLAVVTTEEQ